MLKTARAASVDGSHAGKRTVPECDQAGETPQERGVLSQSLNEGLSQLCELLRTDVSEGPLCARDKMSNETSRFPSLPENKGWETVCLHMYTCLCVQVTVMHTHVLFVHSFQTSIECLCGAGENRKQDR